MTNALLVIDAQKIYTNRKSEMFCKDAAGTIQRINKLIEAFSERKLPVIYIRHQHKKSGSDAGNLFDYEGTGESEGISFIEGSEEVQYDQDLVVKKPTREIVKTRYSAFKNTSLSDTLKSLKVSRIAICGFMTNFCCESTAREAFDLDYFVDFIVDATGTPGTDNFDEKKIRTVVSELLGAGFARVFETKKYLKEVK